MKIWKKALALVVACASLLSLSGCFGDASSGGQGGKDANITYGRYVEEDITPEGMAGYSQAFYHEGNVLDMVTYTWDMDTYLSKYARWRSEDGGESWTALPMDWTEDYQTDYSPYRDGGSPDKEISLGNLTILDNSDLLFVVNEYDYLNGTSSTLVKIADLQGNVRDFDFAPAEELQKPGRSGHIYFSSLGNNRAYMELYSYPTYEDNWSDGMMPEVDPEGVTPFDEDPDADEDGQDGAGDDTAADGGSTTAQTLPATGNQSDASIALNAPAGYDEQVVEIRGIYDLTTGQQILDMVPLNTYSYICSGDTFVYADDMSGQLKAIDLATGAPINAELPTTDELYAQNVYFYNSFISEDFSFYSMDSDGLRRYKQGMEEAEEIMEGINYLYGSPIAWPSYPSMDAEGTIICAVDYDENVRLMRYYYDPDMPATSDQHIKVYSLYDDDGVRMALSEFKRARPEITVSYEYALNRWNAFYQEEDENSVNPDDALRALNIELLAGTGPDVLIMDDLPLQSYMERGILEDLSAVLEGRNLVSQVIEPFKSGDKLYALPTRFAMPVMFGENGYVQQFTTMESLVEAAEQAPGYSYTEPDYENFTEEDWNNYYEEQERPLERDEQPVLRFYELDSLVGTLFELCQPDVYTEKDGLNEANLRTLLEYTKRLSDKYGLTEREIWAENASESYVLGIAGRAMSGANFDDYARNKARLGLYEMEEFYPVTTLPFWEYYGSYTEHYDEELEEWVQTPREDWSYKDTSTVLAPGISGPGVFRPYSIAGVVSTSKQKDLAIEFAGTMLNEDLQSLSRQSYLPVNRDSFEYRLNTTIKESSAELLEKGTKALEIDFDSLFVQLERPVFTNLYLQQIIYNYTLPYCRGETSLDQAVDSIVRETEIYFAERQI